MKQEFIDRMERELAEWRERLDELRLKAGLGKLELREHGQQVLAKLTSIFDRTSDRLRDLKATGASELGALKEATEASWKEFRETYSKHFQDKDEGKGKE